MAKEYDNFTANIVSVVVAVIVVAAVAVPVIVSVSADAKGTTKTILDILPVFLVLAVLMMIVYMFITKKGKN